MVQLKYALALLCLLSWQAHADFPTAKALFEKQEYALAKPQLETLAELGHLEAQFLYLLFQRRQEEFGETYRLADHFLLG